MSAALSPKPDDHRDLMALARAAAQKDTFKIQYFLAGIYGLIPRPVPGLRTMGVTKGGVLYYDPEWIMELAEDGDEMVILVMWVIVHEAIHVYLEHCERIETILKKFPETQWERIRYLLNLSADCVDNVMIRQMGGKLPHGVYPEDYGFQPGLALEEYFDLFQQQDKQQQSQQQQQQSAGGSARSQGGAQGSPQGGGYPSQDAQQDSGQGGGSSAASGAGQQGGQQGAGAGAAGQSAAHGKQPGVGAGQCGGIAGNPVNKDLEDKLDKELGRSEADQANVRKKVEAAIRRHIAEFGRGSVPGALAEHTPLEPERSKIRWQRKLRNVAMKIMGMIESGGMDFSLALPSKSSYARCIPRPGLVQYVPELCFILDTSGSMGTQQTKDAAREIVGVMRSLGIDLAWFLEADTQVAAKPRRIRARDLINEIELHGRGGTDFDAALRAAEKLKPRPDIIFYMTDGDGGVTYKPRVPVVWVVVKSYWNRKPAQWGHTVFVED